MKNERLVFNETVKSLGLGVGDKVPVSKLDEAYNSGPVSKCPPPKNWLSTWAKGIGALSSKGVIEEYPIEPRGVRAEYLRGSEKVILEDLLGSGGQHNWIPVSKLTGSHAISEAPITNTTFYDDESGGHGGTWSVFDFNDRKVRALKRLEKKGLVTVKKVGRSWVAKALK